VDIGLGAAAFWISIFGFFIAMGWFKSRADDRRQETLLRIIERTGQVDEAQVKLLFPPPPAHRFDATNHPWVREPKPGEYRTGMRIAGTIVLSVALGLAILCAFVMENGTPGQRELAIVWMGVAALVACVGGGFHAASFYFPPVLPKNRDDPQAQ
jgi:hypothetical protein